MNILWLDYETYYDDEYCLKKGNGARGLTRTEYINDPRFLAHGAAVAINDAPFQWIDGTGLANYFKGNKDKFDAMCCFNGLFDHGITSRYYLAEEKFLLDAMSMARGVLSTRYPDVGGSLDALAKFLFPNRPELHKQLGVLEISKGKRTLTSFERDQLAGYAIQDGVVMREMFKALLAYEYPWHTALEDIHLTLAMGVYPQLEMDTIRAAAVHRSEVLAKDEVAARLCIERGELRSNEKFAQLLRNAGAVPPMKYSEKTDSMTYAFAAKDEEFKELLDHPNADVRALVSARLGEKSAQKENRAALFARLPTRLPIPLGYAKAHTGRHGGEEYNMQNLGRGSPLRACVRAPKGRKVLVRDLSQIELRMNAWWCDETWLLDLLRSGGDPYCILASKIFGRPITKADEAERFIGKQGELSCGYQSGKAKATASLRSNGVDADLALGTSVVTSYRASHPAIVARWKLLQERAIPVMAGYGDPFEVKGVYFGHEHVQLPSGRKLWYPELRVSTEGEWVYRVNKRRNKGQEWKKLFGGALLENIIQALSYDVFMAHAREAWRAGYRIAMAVHDEMVFVVPEAQAQAANELVGLIQTMPQFWCHDIPLKGEGGLGDTYLEAK